MKMDTWANMMNSGGIDSFDNYIGDTDIADWYVFLSLSRDSEILEISNFETGLARLGGESETVQVARFGHWACGWIEHILIDPQDLEAVKEADCIREELENYPILDEEDVCEKEYLQTIENIQCQGEHLVSDNAPNNWPQKVYGIVGDEDNGIDNMWVSQDRIKQALIEHHPDYLDTDTIAEEFADNPVIVAISKALERAGQDLERIIALNPACAAKYRADSKKGIKALREEMITLATA